VQLPVWQWRQTEQRGILYKAAVVVSPGQAAAPETWPITKQQQCSPQAATPAPCSKQLAYLELMQLLLLLRLPLRLLLLQPKRMARQQAAGRRGATGRTLVGEATGAARLVLTWQLTAKKAAGNGPSMTTTSPAVLL
jgi:hypothetical protein